MERLTNGVGKPGRTWAKGAEQNATFFEETRNGAVVFFCLVFLGRGWLSWKNCGFFLVFQSDQNGGSSLENGECCTGLRSGPFTVRTLLNAAPFLWH